MVRAGQKVMQRGRSRRSKRLRLTLTALIAAVAVLVAATVYVYLATRPEPYRPGEDLGDITQTLSRELPADAPRPVLIDVTAAAGLDGFVHFKGVRTSQLPEDMGSGAAWGDYDNDGDEDLFIVAAGGASRRRPRLSGLPRCSTKTWATGRSGPMRDFNPRSRVIGMGAAWGDYDGDGWQDLVVTTYGELLLFRNELGSLGCGVSSRFSMPTGYWAGAAWGDFDRDGDLDLYVCGYVQYRATDADRARASQQYGRSVPYTLNPASYRAPRAICSFATRATAHLPRLLRLSAWTIPEGRSLGALWHDFDDDGWLDLYVANDISDNAFFHNLGGRFEDISHAAWVADYRGAMGLAAGDWNRDGDDDLFVTHWIAQENALYDSLLTNRPREASSVRRSEPGRPASQPWASSTSRINRGLGQIALRVVGWGTEFADFDGDGWLDLVVVQRQHVRDRRSRPSGCNPKRSMFLWNQQGQALPRSRPAQRPVGRAARRTRSRRSPTTTRMETWIY